MAAAPVHTLTVTNIHHINQHQCFPNKDTRSWSLSLIIDKKNHGGIPFGDCEYARVHAQI